MPSDWPGFIAPDDISELDEEARALRAELRAAAHPNGLRRRFVSWRSPEPAGRLLLGVLVAALFFASLGVFLTPGAPRTPAPRPLAHPSASPGEADALLPDLALATGGIGSVRLRTVRPAVVILLPPECACAPLVSDVIAGTAASRLKVLIVGQRADPSLPSTAPRSRVFPSTDSGGQLTATYQAGAGPLVLFVRSDGTVTRVLRNAQPGPDLRQEIAGLAR